MKRDTRMIKIATKVVEGTKNEDVIEMFLSDSFPKDKKPTWGTKHLKITKQGQDWALVNYSTRLLMRKGGSVYFNTDKYSSTTSTIQNVIRRVAKSKGIQLVEVDGAKIERL